MNLSLEQLKTAFKSREKEQTEKLPNNYYPFWNMKDGEQAVVRFLPDTNPDNPMGFLVEKLTHALVINGEKKSIPCLKMYNEDCPICKVSANYYKNNDKVNGKKYWRKKQHIAQALIVSDPLPANPETGETHKGKVRYIAVGYQLFNVIKEAFESGELDTVPYAYVGGTDFIIKKTKQGDYSTYAVGTKFARTSTNLDDDTVAMVQEHLIDLSTLLPKNPGLEKVQAFLEASLTGSVISTEAEHEEGAPWDDDKSAPAVSPSVATTKPVAPTVQKTITVESSSIDDEAEAILAQIRNRRKKATAQQP